ncbi:MAG: hypothetical protein IJ864_04435 [Alphaproteobacteria bacterium]|nr:hypothetical protein [Alphaproteobacteria bacterium]
MKKKIFDPTTTRGSYAICVLIGVVLMFCCGADNLMVAPLQLIFGSLLWGAILGTVVFALFAVLNNLPKTKFWQVLRRGEKD